VTAILLSINVKLAFSLHSIPFIPFFRWVLVKEYRPNFRIMQMSWRCSTRSAGQLFWHSGIQAFGQQERESGKNLYEKASSVSLTMLRALKLTAFFFLR
jgi:hypothetical protein